MLAGRGRGGGPTHSATVVVVGGGGGGRRRRHGGGRRGDGLGGGGDTVGVVRLLVLHCLHSLHCLRWLSDLHCRRLQWSALLRRVSFSLEDNRLYWRPIDFIFFLERERETGRRDRGLARQGGKREKEGRLRERE